MNNMIDIVIADDNIEYAKLLGEQIGREPDLNILGIVHDGLEIIEMIKTKSPTLVILDLIMPNLDGIGVLEKISSMKLESMPIFIVLSAMGRDLFVKRAMTLGADYYIIKPFSVLVLITRIRQLCNEAENVRVALENTQEISINENKKNDIELKVTNLIHDAGIPANIAGYQFLRDAILLSIEDPSLLTAITKGLYPIVAKKHNSSSQKVERSIRSAIDNAWNRGTCHLGIKPTNGKFIISTIDKITKK